MSDHKDNEAAEPAPIVEPMRIDADLVRQLAALIDERQLSEIEVHDGKRSIRVARKISTGPSPTQAAALAPVSAPVASDPTPVAIDLSTAVKSPMVGTAYLATEPGAKPFVSVGDTVAAGQTLLIIEAMKVMNPIAATHAGRIARILVENGQPIEFDQPLVMLD